jgi:putative drug exporter of the RND superfamily
VVPVLAAVHEAAALYPQIQIAETGNASINKAVNDTVLTDMRRAEALSFPITLLVLLIAFGAVVAAILPLGLAMMAILAANAVAVLMRRWSGPCCCRPR